MKTLATLLPLLLFVFLLGFTLPTQTFAEVVVSDTLVSVYPTIPSPYSQATISISDPLAVPVGSVVRWFVDGVERTDDQNARSITLTTKGVGEASSVELQIGSNPTITATIKPVRMDLIVGANSHVPNFYLGRSLPSRGSQISVQALVYSGAPGPYMYDWSVNGRPVTSAVGGNNSRITFTPGLDYEMFVSVFVYDRTGELVASSDRTIPLAEPEIHFYEQNALQGTLRNVLRSPYNFLKSEITLRGEPYYFSGVVSDLSIKWFIDGVKIPGDQDPLTLSLEKTKESGSAMIELDVINTSNYTDKADASLNVTF